MPFTEIFVVEQNQITGQLPVSISNSSNLMDFDVSTNKLSGNLPSFGSWINYHDFWYTTTILEMGKQLGFKMFINLELLESSHNLLSGSIPLVIGRLQKLKIFYAGRNYFLSGAIPPSIGNLTMLIELVLDGNNIQGNIPSSLDLPSNHLTGVLPDEIGNLKNLGGLSVSRNKLSGSLPNNLGSCYLNLSFNDFEGMIPSEGVFKNATATFVDGNSKLCRGIPPLHLSRCSSYTSTKRSNISLQLKIAVAFVILEVALVFSFSLILWFRNKKEQPTATCAENSLLSYRSILKPTDGFSSQNLVGSGSFGSVHKGILQESGVVIAVKVLNLLNRSASRSFLAECEALKNIRHRNLVKVLTAISGVDYQGNDFKALVYEFIENGSLEDWLHPSADRLNHFSNQSSSLGLRGTIGYAPPEYGIGNELSTKGDVYSYGILLLEMFKTRRPTDEMFKEGFSLYKFVMAALPERVAEIIDPIFLQEGVRGEIDRHLQCWISIFEIGLTCSAESPSERMNMSNVVAKLCSIRDKIHPTRIRHEGQTLYAGQSAGLPISAKNIFLEKRK
ncbi:LRR receptor-like serine/threonine-protein kinase EFR [Durio zibethinus]|uniref:LRR receptor-like serine/threonine-protein kinase EFR n=1 Tax=Durio zibethinus TaxID=66656 RepID=A0A6P6AHH2_DURZI|nr:LRR receptor-like serine/threonine-protein kinase EFR [Durio zibethinus]